MQFIKDLSLCMLISFAATVFSWWLQSPFLAAFFSQGLITLLVALLAINITAVGFISSKLGEFSRRNGQNFDPTLHELNHSIRAQIALIALVAAIQIIGESPIAQSYIPHLSEVSVFLAGSAFVFAILILRDTSDATFLLAKHEREMRD